MNRMLITALVSAITATGLMAQAATKSASDLRLEQKVASVYAQLPASAQTPQAQVMSLNDGLAALTKFSSAAEGHTQKCADAKKVVFAQKYVMSYDADGKPCRIYDLSFPTLKTFMASLQMPVQSYTSDDYLNWLGGDFAAIQKSAENFKKNFNAQTVARDSWIGQLKFRHEPTRVNGLPQSFRASDLDIGTFQFDGATRQQIQKLIAQSYSFNASEPLISEYWAKVLNRPETLLEGIKFNWNDAQKVYDVVMEGEFLPISGPVSLVDYKVQYKIAVERMVRSFLASGLSRLTVVIPVPMVRSAINVVVNESFEQLEMAYSYQMIQLEDTLRANSTDRFPLGITQADSTEGLNVLFGERADLMNAYIMAVAQGKAFDWQSMDKIGKTARYNTEKAYNVARANMNSKLVLQSGCQVELLHDYFGLCSKAGQKDTLYSLISEQTVFGFSFGAPVTYRFQRPWEVAVVRGGTWALSIGLRVIDLPINGSILSQLNTILKNYMTTGLLDEAYLRNNLMMTNTTGDMVNWLYIQNLNPFLPKSIASEKRVIDLNLKGMN